MRQILGQYIEPIRQETLNFLTQSQKEVYQVTDLVEPVYEIIKDYVVKGKFLRGSLVLFTNEFFEPEFNQKALKVAVATELFHAALLIQDDVMDNSNLRRGGMSMHKSLEGLGNRFDFRESQKIGESLALCAADVLIFLAYKLLDDLKLVDLFSRELHKTSFGQMLDVIGSAQEGTLTKDAILNIYKFKTARYTFTLPFMAACICAGQNPKQFEELGEDLGLIFNLKDDYLDFSDVSGKVKGLDFKENKQTMYRLLLSQKINIPETFEEYKQALEDQEIFSQVDSVILEYHMKILTTISNLNIPDDKKSELGQLATNLLKRVN